MTWELIEGSTFPFPNDLRSALIHAPQSSGHELNLLDIRLGHFVGRQAREFCQNIAVTPQYLGWHGHTVFHDPHLRSTCQIGHGAGVAAESGLPVVSQFRQLDLSLGGQGAPLAPMADRLLMPPADYYLNLGGICNISCTIGLNLKSYDVCACNQVLNRLAEQRGLHFDDRGALASTGVILRPLLKKLEALEYYKRPFPKSIDNNWVVNIVWPIIETANGSVEDKLRTCVEHIGGQIAQQIRKTKENTQSEILITGGGAHNDFLIKCLREKLSSRGCQVVLPPVDLIDYKEAALIGVMTYLFVKGIPNVYASATGSRRDHIGGCIFHAPREENVNEKSNE